MQPVPPLLRLVPCFSQQAKLSLNTQDLVPPNYTGGQELREMLILCPGYLRLSRSRGYRLAIPVREIESPTRLQIQQPQSSRWVWKSLQVLLSLLVCSLSKAITWLEADSSLSTLSPPLFRDLSVFSTLKRTLRRSYPSWILLSSHNRCQLLLPTFKYAR